MFAAGSAEAALAFIEIGAVVLGLGLLARLAGRLGITAVPLYLIAGLAFGEGGVARLDVSEDFIALAAEIGVLLLLFTLGPRVHRRRAARRAAHRRAARPGRHGRSTPARCGCSVCILGWDPLAAVLLGGVTWISSIGRRLEGAGRPRPARQPRDAGDPQPARDRGPGHGRLPPGGRRADRGRDRWSRRRSASPIALVAVIVILLAALRYGRTPQRLLAGGSDESLLLAVFGITLLVAGIAQQLEVSGADRRLPRRPGAVGPRRGAGRAADLAAARPVRGDLLPLLLVPDRPGRPGRVAASAAVALAVVTTGDEGGHGLVRRAHGSASATAVGCEPAPC